MILCAEKSQETIELLELDKGSIHVAQYLTKMPPKELLEAKLLEAISIAKAQLDKEMKTDSIVKDNNTDGDMKIVNKYYI